MPKPPYKITVTIGALARRHVRRELQSLPAAFTEEKGFLDSQFIITELNYRQYQILMAWFQSMADDSEK